MNQMANVSAPVTVSFGRYWAAIRDGYIVGLISMSIPKDVDYKKFREKAYDCLGLLGDVKSGELLIVDGVKCFSIPRANHQSGRNKRNSPKYIPVKTEFGANKQ